MLNPFTFRKGLFSSLALGAVLLMPQAASAASFSYQPSPIDLNDLDHHLMYTWRVDNVNLNGGTVYGATLTIANIANWDTNPAQLFIHLLDTAVGAGVQSYADATGTPVPVNQINDNFVFGQVGYSTLVGGSGVGNTFLTAPTAYFAAPPSGSNQISMTPKTFTYTFSSGENTILQNYILNGGNFALAFDPDCHFNNDGITFAFSTSTPGTPVPEPATLTLLGLGIAGAVARRRRAVSAQ